MRLSALQGKLILGRNDPLVTCQSSDQCLTDLRIFFYHEAVQASALAIRQKHDNRAEDNKIGRDRTSGQGLIREEGASYPFTG